MRNWLIRARSLQSEDRARAVEFRRLSTNPAKVATQAATAIIVNTPDTGIRNGTFSIPARL